MSYYLFKTLLITQDCLEIYPFFILNTISSKTFFSFYNNWIEQSRQIYSKFRKFEHFLKKYPDYKPLS